MREDNCIICSDFHVPLFSEDWVSRILKYAAENKIKSLIIAGDFWNFDAISRFKPRDCYTLPQELKVGRKILDRLREHFPILYVVKGNHDERLSKILENKWSFSEFMGETHPEVIVTDNNFMVLDSGNEKFIIAHAETYSKIKGRIVSDLAHCKNSHVLAGHSHNFSLGYSHTGKFLAVDLGCMIDPAKALYKAGNLNGYPEWDNAFVHLKNGKIRVISEATW